MRTTLKEESAGAGRRRERQRPPILPPGALTPDHALPPAGPASRTRSAGRRPDRALGASSAIADPRRRAARRRRLPLRPPRASQAVAAHTAGGEDRRRSGSTSRCPAQPAIALVMRLRPPRDEAKGTPSRSDTMMLLRADPQTKTISMLSFPRDLIVDDRLPGQADRSADKINAAYARVRRARARSRRSKA